MNIIICGAGTVGSHTAEVLASAGHAITMIDLNADRLALIEETMDVRTLEGNCVYGEVLLSGGAAKADLLFAATESDEINLLSASVAKGLGVDQTIARVRHSAYFTNLDMDYGSLLGIDHFISPEHLTAITIAATLRNPGALAIENFARGRVQMQEMTVGTGVPAGGRTLSDLGALGMPSGTRVAALTREGVSRVPEARTEIHAGDTIVLVGNADVFSKARKLFRKENKSRRSVAIMGGSTMAVWLCRALKDHNFAIRLFEINRERAEELAEKLEWATVINADPTDPTVFADEHLAEADVFVALRTEDDEHNILSCAWAKSLGVKRVACTVQRPNYLHLMKHVGIDYPFAPRTMAVKEIENILLDRRLHQLATLAAGSVDVYQVKMGTRSPVVGKALREIRLSPEWVIAAIQNADGVKVPRADDAIGVGDTVLVIGRSGEESKLKKVLGVD